MGTRTDEAVTNDQIIDELVEAGIPGPLLWDAMCAVRRLMGEANA